MWATNGKGKYFGKKRPPPPQGDDKFYLEKNRKEIQLEKKNDKTVNVPIIHEYFPCFR